MAFQDIPLGSYMKFEDGESHTLALVGEPEMVEKFGETKPVLTVYHLYQNAWHCRTWQLSVRTVRALQAEHKKRGNSWGPTAYTITRRGATTDTTYEIATTAIQVPAGLVPLTQQQMGRGKFDRESIPAEGQAQPTPSAAAPAPSPRILRAKYRGILAGLDDKSRDYLVEAYGDAESCPDDALAEAIDQSAIPF
jgi:hypothetical protein